MSLGQNSLNNFYTSIKFHDPRVATIMTDDVLHLALSAVSRDMVEGQKAADNLRKKALDYDLPDSLLRVLNTAISQLGYS